MDKRAPIPLNIDVILGRHPEHGFVIDGDVSPEAEAHLLELGYNRNQDDILTLTPDLDEPTARTRHVRAAQLLAATGHSLRVLSDDEASRFAAVPTPDAALETVSTRGPAGSSEAAERAIAADAIPDAVIDVVRAASAFEDTVQRIGTAELAHAATGLDAVHLAYLFDRLDDVRASIGEILSAMLDEGLTVLNDDSARMVSEVDGDLESAGQGLVVVISELDPESARHDLTIP